MTDQNPTQPTRVIKIGATKIIADATMSQLSPEQLRETLKINYPEIAHATLRETTLEDGTVCIEWIPVPGRKG
jgi:hypothetical protein